MRRRFLAATRFLPSVALLAACAGAPPSPPTPASAPWPLPSGEGWRVVPRAEWGALPADTSMLVMHTPSRITIHHTGSRQQPDRPFVEKLRGLQQFSQNPGRLASGGTKPAWADIPYHFYIDAAGRIAEARDARYAGDTNTTYDTRGHLLIVLEGSFGTEQPSAAQLQSLENLVLWLARRWNIGAHAIQAHRDFAATACPGDNLDARLPELRALVAREVSP